MAEHPRKPLIAGAVVPRGATFETVRGRENLPLVEGYFEGAWLGWSGKYRTVSNIESLCSTS